MEVAGNLKRLPKFKPGIAADGKRFASGPRPVPIRINYLTQMSSIRDFLLKWRPQPSAKDVGLMGEHEVEQESAEVMTNYRRQLQMVADHQLTTVTVELEDVAQHDAPLAVCIGQNTHHYLELFAQVIDEILPTLEPSVSDVYDVDVVEMIMRQREARLRAKNLLPQSNSEPTDANHPNNEQHDGGMRRPEPIPRQLLRRYAVTFVPVRGGWPPLAVRDVKAPLLGTLLDVRCIVTKVGEVRPQLQVATFLCDQCGMEVYQEVTASAFMPVGACPSEQCARKDGRGRLTLQTRGSRFVRFQEARVQELSEQVPVGHIPRAITVHLTGDLVRTLAPGDHVILSAIYLPRPYTGFRAIKAGLLTDTYLLVQAVQHTKLRYADATHGSLAEDLRLGVERLTSDPKSYDRLARSIAPEIFGHLDVKRALLLLMVGGVSVVDHHKDNHDDNNHANDKRENEDGKHDGAFKIRGDINICLMGDPGVAKSQLLRAVCKLAPRSIYTTGKGSSGVGLTAAVTRDAVTGELQLEGGALVLADNGICCIDEFDKMDERDRTAIHEVMEQQTISIAKAGITTTLHARASVLAAANPLYGRYNPKRSPRDNINLPPALLSRFDLLFLLLDTADPDLDAQLAAHITRLHIIPSSPKHDADDDDAKDGGIIPLPTISQSNHYGLVDDVACVPPEVLRAYVALARRYQPTLPEALVPTVVDAYVSMRQHDLTARDATYTTARTLLAVLRLSSALARLRFSDTISQADLDEALRLTALARAGIDAQLPNPANGRKKRSFAPGKDDDPTDVSASIYALIRDLSVGHKTISLDLIRQRVRRRGYSDEQLQRCLVDFDTFNVWRVSSDGTDLVFLD